MTTYTAIADSEIDVDSPITESLLTRFRNNPIAITEGASGAPKIKQAAIDAAAVGQSQLKTASGTASVSGTVSGGGNSPINLYLDFSINTSGYGTAAVAALNGSNANFFRSSALPGGDYSFTPTLYLAISGASRTGYGKAFYVQASPPYDHGDGVVGLYNFALVNKNGEVIATYCAPDAPWHFAGPHPVKASRYGADGKTYFREKKINAEIRAAGFANHSQAVKSGMFTPRQLVERIASDDMVEVEITRAMKNANFQHLKHPFADIGKDETVILLDPAADMSHILHEHHKNGGSVSELLHNNHLVIGDKVNRKGLDGLAVHSVKWKN
jgi:hypothetical protein